MKLTTQITILIAALAAGANISSAATVAEWNFNDTGSGTEAQRMPVALGASSVTSGLTVTPLNINASFDFAGFNNLPGSANDGYGFGGNSGESVIFISRAEYFNGGSGVTTWGSPSDTPGVSTTVGNAPLYFTVTTDSLTTLTLNSVNIVGLGIGGVYLVEFQEAAASVGPVSSASNSSATAFLASPVIIGPGQSKSFTINLNSGALNSDHVFNTITLDGTVAAIPEPSMAAWLPVMLISTLFRRRRLQRNQA